MFRGWIKGWLERGEDLLREGPFRDVRWFCQAKFGAFSHSDLIAVMDKVPRSWQCHPRPSFPMASKLSISSPTMHSIDSQCILNTIQMPYLACRALPTSPQSQTPQPLTPSPQEDRMKLWEWHGNEFLIRWFWCTFWFESTCSRPLCTSDLTSLPFDLLFILQVQAQMLTPSGSSLFRTQKYNSPPSPPKPQCLC